MERDLAQAKGYHCFFSHCTVPRKASYSGVATFVRSDSGLKTLASTNSLADNDFFGSHDRAGSFSAGLGSDRLRALDSEGRVLVTDHGHFVLFNVYAPCTRCVLPCLVCVARVVFVIRTALLPCMMLLIALMLNVVWLHVSTGNRSRVCVFSQNRTVAVPEAV